LRVHCAQALGADDHQSAIPTAGCSATREPLSKGFFIPAVLLGSATLEK